MVLWVITAINQHDYRSSYADPAAAYTSKMGCEAALKKDPPQGRDAECTPFRANMGPISTLYFCRGCTEEQSAEAMKGVGGRVLPHSGCTRDLGKNKSGAVGIDNPRWSTRAIRSF